MRKVFIIVHHRILTKKHKTNISCHEKHTFFYPASGWLTLANLLFCALVLDSQPLVEFFLPDSLLGQPPTKRKVINIRKQGRPILISLRGNTRFRCSQDAVQALHLHEILVSGLAELDEVRLDAVHPLVDLPVVCCLFLQVFFQPALAVYYFTNPRFQLLVISHDPGRRGKKGWVLSRASISLSADAQQSVVCSYLWISFSLPSLLNFSIYSLL